MHPISSSEEMYVFDGGSAFYVTSFGLLITVAVVLTIIIYLIWHDLKQKQKEKEEDVRNRQPLEP